MIVRISSSRAAASLLALMTFASHIPSTASAGSISTTYTFAPVTLDGFQTSFSRTFQTEAAQFNPALGTLDEIDVDWAITLSATVTQTSGTVGEIVGSSGGGPVTFDTQTYSGISLSANGATTELNVPLTLTDTEGAPETQLIAGMTSSPAEIQAAIGTGTVPVVFDFSGVFGTGPDSDFSDVSTTSFGTVQVTYDFSPASTVPLPSSLKTSLVGLAALGLFGLRKTAKAAFAFGRVG